ncbi:uncharacterized protein LOC123531964 [Mercenaria mercenaria]|uniref:uncharacterized protein LOC123531964 n=1 Tax=Mercenaria mercenaria TaxID=6596 RepID=UPI00234F5427|nr:uncharacterized protein LOC123531964 [Mercenaria mercenaria]XP_045169221.2 uncharacterized protein LOC123531964 [Mercenaria mercenaria]
MNSSEEASLNVSEMMDRLGYSYEMVKFRQQMAKERPVTWRNNLAETIVVTGGKGEGTALYCESDVDCMYIADDVICADNPDLFIDRENVTLFKTERQETPPGYTLLKMVRFGGKSYEDQIRLSILESNTGTLYLSNQLFTNAIEMTDRPNRFRDGYISEETSGPSTPSSNEYQTFDEVSCFTCSCPDILVNWLSRSRNHAWPSLDTIHEISRLDGHVVPVGFKGSSNSDREWRICYSLAELHLFKTLGDTQLKIYILLKQIAKSVLQPICKEITSYVMKNIVLWVCESRNASVFKNEMLMRILIDALLILKLSISENSLPSYMIPDRNIFAGRLDIYQRNQLTRLIEDLLKDGKNMFLRIGRFREAMLLVSMVPNTFKKYCEKRDKVESLMLMMGRIRAEAFRPGMSVREVNNLSWRNELYCSMWMQINVLIRFDHQALRQAGMTDEEIGDLWAKRLNQFLS